MKINMLLCFTLLLAFFGSAESLSVANLVEENAPGVGGWGGSCTCPDGSVYQVGDNFDHCGSLACIGGVSGTCNPVHGEWAYRKVTCAELPETEETCQDHEGLIVTIMGQDVICDHLQADGEDCGLQMGLLMDIYRNAGIQAALGSGITRDMYVKDICPNVYKDHCATCASGKSFSFEARESYCSVTEDSWRDFWMTEGSHPASEQECEEFCSNWDECIAYSFWFYAEDNTAGPHNCMAFNECNSLIPTGSSAEYVVTRSLMPLTEEERCGSCRLRRNWNSMSPDDRRTYIDTVNIARTDERFKSQYDELVMSHGNLPFGVIHGSVEFMAWHRWFIFEFENILRQITPCITVPYWAWEVAGNNWMQDEIWGSASHQFGRCGSGQVQDGPFSDMILPGTNTRLSRNCGGALPKLHTMTFLSSTSTNFWSFKNRLQNAHNTIHMAIGGTMLDGSISGMAPEFFLHHNNIDRMWADWQLLSREHEFAQPNRDAPLTGTNGYTVADFTSPHEQAPTGTQETCVEFESQIDRQNVGRRRLSSMLSSKATKVNLVVTMSNQLPTDSVFESLLVYTDELSLQNSEDFEAASLIFAETQKGGSLSDERAHEIAHLHQENSEWGHYIKERKVDTGYAPDSEAKAFFADIVGITPESVRNALETTHKFEGLRTFNSQFEQLEKLFNKIHMPL